MAHAFDQAVKKSGKKRNIENVLQSGLVASLQQEQKFGWPSGPMGTRLYVVEAEGRARSQAHMA